MPEVMIDKQRCWRLEGAMVVAREIIPVDEIELGVRQQVFWQRAQHLLGVVLFLAAHDQTAPFKLNVRSMVSDFSGKRLKTVLEEAETKGMVGEEEDLMTVRDLMDSLLMTDQRFWETVWMTAQVGLRTMFELPMQEKN